MGRGKQRTAGLADGGPRLCFGGQTPVCFPNTSVANKKSSGVQTFETLFFPCVSMLSGIFARDFFDFFIHGLVV